MRALHSIYNKFKIFVREHNNKIFGNLRRKKLLNPYFTIISNNCWGGHVYRYFNMKYLSPTIGLFFFEDDFIKFCNNLRYYIESELEIIDIRDSKHYLILKNKNYSCPIGKIQDIEIVFLHYKSEKEAKEKWTRRCKRIVWNNIFIKNSQQNSCTISNVLDFDKLEFNNKFIFTTKDYNISSQVFFDGGFLNGEEIPNDTVDFRKYINLIKWLNCKNDFKLKQDKLRKKLK